MFQAKDEPFLLKPAAKDYLWGGTRLNDDFGKNIPLFPLAETWECSTHRDGLSVVASGIFCGKTLKSILQENPEFLGTNHQNPNGEIPILIKLIDAKFDLSVQVHPTNEYAKIHENGERGKSEMWYVLDAAPNASIFCGFSRDFSKDEIRKNILTPNFARCLQKIPVKKNDLLFIASGTVHALGAGCLVAEIQENSNLTYRLYDYNRLDKNGKPRSLHIEKALDVANLKPEKNPRYPMRVTNFKRGHASELLCRCSTFCAYRIFLNTENYRELTKIERLKNTFQAILCVEGCGIIESQNSFLKFFKGDCIFLPAGTKPVTLHGKANLLLVRC